MKTGESPNKAVSEIIKQSASEILKMYLTAADDRKWTPDQAWVLIKSLAAQPEGETLKYNAVLLDDAFKNNGDGVLQALEQAELISIVSSGNGRPYAIKPGKPVFQPAFQKLVGDTVLRSKMDLLVLGNLIKGATADIEKAEGELRLLGELPSQPREVVGRVRYLLGKLAGAQVKVEQMEAESGELKKVLVGQY